MSRVGKRAIAVPSGVTANVEGQTVKVKGPKGALQAALHDDVTVKLDGAEIKIEPRAETKRARSQWGTSRTLVASLISGVTKGVEQLALGYSHDIVYPIPEGISIATPRPVEIVITGSDRQKVGQVAAEIREYRPPEPYKGKGIKYAAERIFRKEGKKK
jgi:large subunit ribosomal protein L6